MSDDPVAAELLVLCQLAGPKRPGAFERAATIRELLAQANRADTIDSLLLFTDRALLRLEEPDLQHVARASLRRAPYTDEFLEERLTTCADLMARQRQEARRQAGRVGDVPPYSLKTMFRRRDRMVDLLAPLLREETQQPDNQPKGGTAPKKRPIAGDKSEFVADISIPDGTLVPPGEVIEKRWELRNAGSVPWRGRYLSRLGASEGYSIPQTAPRVQIADTGPGENVVISVQVCAPDRPGTYVVHWKMADAFGRQYFPDRYWGGIWFTITVPGAH